MALLTAIVAALETDKGVKVVVFETAIDGFFDSLRLPRQARGHAELAARAHRLAAVARCVGKVESRACGLDRQDSRARHRVGNELAVASDMRFGSREKAILPQWEVGCGLVPGGGPMARLPRLLGRGRALEVLLGVDDIRGDIAELYGYINRALPDDELDGFVDALAGRIASFEKHAIAETKRLANQADLPSDAEIQPEWDAFMASLVRPATQARIKKLMERGFHKPGDVETRLGYHVGQLSR
jgi:hypothetical protein